ncbi:hypothetical protein [Mobilicoccus massiliensis]|uniref:hypothetical protein n=1 Tax=Mobilicoccus massiliensis TaxID=1522310 RepID=UPI001142CCAB|nr:hypothetical protein [Mobilicoccus massiliensis]
MAGGWTSRGALGIPIGERHPGGVEAAGEQNGSGVTSRAPGRPATARSVPPRRLPFVFVGPEGAPGLVVEQRRGESGWQVLVALVEAQPDGSRALSVRWLEASGVRPAVREPAGLPRDSDASPQVEHP